ncbi:MAG: replication-relaxation family protein [Anaerolineales bacterium]|nr:replication-relaxation family protein [Anaerolineales bacterium]
MPVNRNHNLNEHILILIATLEFVTAHDLTAVTQAETIRITAILKELTDDKLIESTWLPAETAEKGTWVYFLSTRGARVAGKLMNERVIRPRIDDRVSLMLHHRAAISQVVSSLAAALGFYRLELCLVGSRLRAVMKSSSLKNIYFPDAHIAFAIRAQNKCFTRHVFLEIDRGTERKRQLVAKLNALSQYYLQDHQRLFRTDRLLLAVTVPSEARLQTIASVVHESKCRVRVFAALDSQLHSKDQALGSWIDCSSGGQKHLLQVPENPVGGLPK